MTTPSRPASGATRRRRILLRGSATAVALALPLAMTVTQSLTSSKPAPRPISEQTGDAGDATNAAAYRLTPPFVVRPISPNQSRDTRSFRSGRSAGTTFNAKCGTPVRASHPGEAKLYPKSRWGGPHTVAILSNKGSIVTRYNFMRSHSIVDGQVIQSGQKIGTVGKLGKARRCSLKMTVRKGSQVVNPTRWLANNEGKRLRSGGLYGDAGFNIASLNILGASHTSRGGNKASWPGYAKRLPMAIAKLNEKGAQVVGLQEMQPRQRELFLKQVGADWSIYPSTTKADPENSIIWRKNKFDLIEGKTFAVPYFDGHIRQMPYVLLRDRTTGRTAYVINVHNPASTGRYPNQGKWRREAIRRERQLMINLRASGRPVFLTGDFNDREKAFCPLTAGKLSISPDSIPSMTCAMPKYYWVDWIFAAGQTRFTTMEVDTSLDDRRITDHPLVIARAHLQD